MKEKINLDSKIIKNLERKVENEINQIKNLKEKDILDKNSDVISMMNYYSKLTNDIELRRNNINNFTIQLLAICIASITVIITNISKLSIFIIFFSSLGLIVLLIYCILSLFTFIKQSGYKYQFIKIKKFSNKWKWFYYGNEFISKINSNSIFPSKKSSKTVEPYLKGLAFFISKYKNENSKKKLIDNLQQLFLLQVHNYYKNKFILKLEKIRSIFIEIIIIFLIIFFVSFGLLLKSEKYYTLFINSQNIAIDKTDSNSLQKSFLSQIENQYKVPISELQIDYILIKSKSDNIIIVMKIKWINDKNVNEKTLFFNKNYFGVYISSFLSSDGTKINLLLK